jgi:hypothetical protein
MRGIIAGALTGMALGAILVLAVSSGAETYAGVRFGKQPFVWAVAGMLAGGVLGGFAGRWSVTYDTARRGRQ